MSHKSEVHVPSISDAAVKAKTGKDWAGWFATLDEAGADKSAHPVIAKWVSEVHSLPAWWCQCVTGEYERARTARAPPEL
jgi:hypothetical protein